MGFEEDCGVLLTSTSSSITREVLLEYFSKKRQLRDFCLSGARREAELKIAEEGKACESL